MTTQISVRLPDELVEFVDRIVQRSAATSRAAVITRLLAREQRRERALRDLEVIAGTPDPEMDSVVEWQRKNMPVID